MLDIFGITMTPQYGEGMHAFMRLQHVLLGTSADESLFAWHMSQASAGKKYHHDDESTAVTASGDWASDKWDRLAPSLESGGSRTSAG